MPSLNKVTIIGNLGKDPEMRFTPNGAPVTSFSIATNRTRAAGADGERRVDTEWFSVVAWNKLAEICNQYLGKGSLVYIEGRLQTRSWDGQDGQKHSRTEIVANDVQFLDRRGGSLDDGAEAVADEGGDLAADDLPF